MGTVVGWGRLSEGGNLADIVQEVQVPILSLAQCRATKYRPQRITPNMICAGKGVEDSCQVSDYSKTIYSPSHSISVFSFEGSWNKNEYFSRK